MVLLVDNSTVGRIKKVNVSIILNSKFIFNMLTILFGFLEKNRLYLYPRYMYNIIIISGYNMPSLEKLVYLSKRLEMSTPIEMERIRSM